MYSQCRQGKLNAFHRARAMEGAKTGKGRLEETR
jgi:hypothetical protein